MSIIDGPYQSEEDVRAAARAAAPMFEAVMAQPGLSPRLRSVIELIREGFTIAEIFDIPKEEREALLAVGARLLKVGDAARARDVLSVLLQIDPSDARILYTLAGCYQAEGNLPAAAQLYLLFLARDATNPQGYLRLGECFLAAKEYEKARDSFKVALIEEERAAARLKIKDYARHMMNMADELLAAESSSLKQEPS